MRTAGLVVAFALVSAPLSARAEEKPPAEEEAEPVEAEPPVDEGVSPVVFGVSAGATLGAGYIATIVVGALAAADAESGGGKIAGHACIPIVGPIVILGDDQVSDGFAAGLVVTGAAQALGAVTGLAAVSYAGSTRRSVSVAPTPGGVVVTGRF